MTKENKMPSQWVTVTKFIKHYDLSQALGYELIHAKGFPSMKVSTRAYRVDLSRTDEFFEKFYK